MSKIVCQGCNGNGYIIMRIAREIAEPVDGAPEYNCTTLTGGTKIITIERVTILCEACQGEGLLKQRL